MCSSLPAAAQVDATITDQTLTAVAAAQVGVIQGKFS